LLLARCLLAAELALCLYGSLPYGIRSRGCENETRLIGTVVRGAGIEEDCTIDIDTVIKMRSAEAYLRLELVSAQHSATA
jgi:hypothetical protein